MDTTGSIAFFDSGFGGLDVFREVRKYLPDYSYIYLADSARAPYGSKTKDEVLECTREAVEFLFAKGATLIVLACNTASSDALRTLQQTLVAQKYPDRNILGVIFPAAEKAIEVTKTGRIGVIGTEQTISSKSFEREVMKLKQDAQLFSVACPKLVPLIEAGNHASRELDEALVEYLTPLLRAHIDTLILGCTHYGLIKEKIEAIVGPSVRVVREADEVPEKLQEYLSRHGEFASQLSHEPSVTFYTTDQTDRFERLGSTFYGAPINANRLPSLEVDLQRSHKQSAEERT